ALFPCLHGDSPLSAAWIGLALATDSDTAHYIPLAHRYMGAPAQLSEARVSAWLKDLLQAKPDVVAYDGKSLMVLLQERGISLTKCAFDVLLASYLLDAGGAQDLERIAKAQLDAELLPYETLFKKKSRRSIPVDELDVADAAAYFGRRAATLLVLRGKLEPKLEEETLD